MVAKSPTDAVPRGPSLVLACAVLTGVVALAYPVVSMVASQAMHRPIWLAAAIGAGLCWFSSLLGLVAFHCMRSAGNAMAGTMAAMLIRVSIPMAIGVFLTVRGGSLADDGVFGFVLLFYMLTLAADMLLMVGMVKSSAGGAMSSRGGDGGSRNG